ncbi:hypothetical protein ACFL35_17280, partial [Candidatus Riflebacteria bacterium]
NHITGDNLLLNYGLKFTQPNGTLFITHIENSSIFEQYMNVISKIPDLPTDLAQETIKQQLLKEPLDYINSCIGLLTEKNLHINIKPIIKMGHAVSDYKNLLNEHKVDLLIFNTKEEEQLAMNGMAYSLVVEMTQIPLLLL